MAKAIKSPPKLKINWRGLRPVSLRTILQPPHDFLSPQKTGHVLLTSHINFSASPKKSSPLAVLTPQAKRAKQAVRARAPDWDLATWFACYQQTQPAPRTRRGRIFARASIIPIPRFYALVVDFFKYSSRVGLSHSRHIECT